MGKIYGWLVQLCLLICLPYLLTGQINKTGVCISMDGKVMIYTGASPEGETLFYQASKNAMWQWDEGVAIKSINRYIDTSYIVVKDPFLSYDGQTLYFVAKTSTSKGFDIFYSELKNGEWQKPMPMDEIINTNDDEESPTLTADNKTFYFTRKPIPVEAIDNDKMCRTLYRADYDYNNNAWLLPRTFKISANGCDAYPLIMPDGKTLLFSSSKLPQKRKRKHDIYYVKQTSEGVWGLPQEIEAVNTEADEVSVAVDYWAKLVYVIQAEQSKNEVKSKLGMTKLPEDIAVFTFTLLNGQVADAKNDTPVQTKIEVKDPVTLNLINVVQSDKNGKFRLVLQNGKDYKLDFFAPDYSQYTRDYILTKTTFNYNLNDNIKLFKTVQLKMNVYDKAVFNPVNAKITATDTTSNFVIDAVKQNIAGQFIIDLPVGKVYNVKIEHPDFVNQTFAFDISGTIYYPNFEENIALSADKKSYIITVVSERKKKLPNINIDLINKNIEESVDATKQKEGVFTALLRKNNTYNFTVTHIGYAFDNRIVKVNNNQTADSIKVQFIPLIKYTKIGLSTVKFTDNATDLNVESYRELLCLVNLMIENPEIKIEIGAYTDNKGNDAFCQRLTTKQASVIRDYLISQGVTRDRITVKGFGKEYPENIYQTGGEFSAKPHFWYTLTEGAKMWFDVPVIELVTKKQPKKTNNNARRK